MLVTGRNRVISHFQMEKGATKKNRVVSYFEIKENMKGVNGNTFDVSFFY